VPSELPHSSFSIQPVSFDDEQRVQLVAQRMRSTLIEVIGQVRGEAMYSLDWLIERVRFHLDGESCRGQVWCAEGDTGDYLGHTIVRVENGKPEFGLFSTIYVEPHARRLGVARALVRHGEAWMREQNLTRFATNTGAHNRKLICLFESLAYSIVLRDGEMVQLARADTSSTSNGNRR